MTNYPNQPPYQTPPQFQPQHYPPQGKGTDGFGIAALVVGIVACLIAWVPLCGMAALPLAVIGLVLAIVGVIISVSGKRTPMTMSIVGGIICLIAIGIQVVVMSWVSGKVEQAAEQAQVRLKEMENEMKAAQEAAAKEAAAAATQPSSRISVGEQVQIQTDDVVYGTTDLSAVSRLRTLQDQGKQDDIDKLVKDGKAIAFKDGDVCNVLAVMSKSYKVSPTSGDKAGKTFFVPTEAVRRND